MRAADAVAFTAVTVLAVLGFAAVTILVRKPPEPPARTASGPLMEPPRRTRAPAAASATPAA